VANRDIYASVGLEEYCQAVQQRSSKVPFVPVDLCRAPQQIRSMRTDSVRELNSEGFALVDGEGRFTLDAKTAEFVFAPHVCQRIKPPFPQGFPREKGKHCGFKVTRLTGDLLVAAVACAWQEWDMKARPKGA